LALFLKGKKEKGKGREKEGEAIEVRIYATSKSFVAMDFTEKDGEDILKFK
jgi:hypothetical protein